MNYQAMVDEMKRLENRVALALAKAAASSGSSTAGGLTPPANGSWAQAAWFINPATGSDSNPGTTALLPLKTWRQLVALWGTTSPILGQSTTITFQGVGHTDNSDPVIFSPRIKNGATILITGSLQTAVWTGTLSGTVAKNRATPVLLQETLPAGAAAGQLVVNTTHPSRAWVYTAAGGSWNMTQPMLTPAAPFALSTGPVEVNTWANGDAVSGFLPTAINLALLEPMVLDESSGDQTALYVEQCIGFEPFPGRGDFLQVNAAVIFVDVSNQKYVAVNPDNGLSGTSATSNTGSSNTVYSAGLVCNLVPVSGQGHGGVWLCLAGIVAQSGGQSYALDADVIVSATGSNTNVNGAVIFGLVFFDTGATVGVYAGTLQVANTYAFGGPQVWGPGGSIDVRNNAHATYPTGGGSAVATFTGATSSTRVLLNGTATGHSVTAGSPDVFNGAIAITAAALDAATGAAGFGGNAFNPGNASISNLQG